jgi:hypothetical protein
MPVKPARQTEQVFGILKQAARFSSAQNNGEATELLTIFTVDAILFTACTTPSKLPEEKELIRLAVRTNPISILELSWTIAEIEILLVADNVSTA